MRRNACPAERRRKGRARLTRPARSGVQQQLSLQPQLQLQLQPQLLLQPQLQPPQLPPPQLQPPQLPPQPQLLPPQLPQPQQQNRMMIRTIHRQPLSFPLLKHIISHLSLNLLAAGQDAGASGPAP